MIKEGTTVLKTLKFEDNAKSSGIWSKKDNLNPLNLENINLLNSGKTTLTIYTNKNRNGILEAKIE